MAFTTSIPARSARVVASEIAQELRDASRDIGVPFLIGLMAATAASIFPVMLRAVGDGSLSITALNASNDAQGLRTALGWWVIGIPLVITYFVIQFKVHAGKAVAPGEGEGY